MPTLMGHFQNRPATQREVVRRSVLVSCWRRTRKEEGAVADVSTYPDLILQLYQLQALDQAAG
jgi:hypothetical protein